MAILVIVVVAVVAFSAWIWFWLRPPQPSTTILEPLDIGRVFSGGFEAFAMTGWPLLLLGVVFVVLPHVAQDYVSRMILTPQMRRGVISPLQLVGIDYAMQFGIGMISMIFHIAMLIRLVGIREDRPIAWQAAMAAIPRAYLPMLAMRILALLGYVVGFAAFLVPAVIMMLSWSVAAIAFLVEGHGVLQAFSRSRELTFGSRWRMLIVFLLAAAIGGLIAAIGILLAHFAPQAPWLPIVWASLISLPVAIFGLGLSASLYTELRRSREGIASPGLVEVFS